jgi:hypothetical protein
LLHPPSLFLNLASRQIFKDDVNRFASYESKENISSRTHLKTIFNENIFGFFCKNAQENFAKQLKTTAKFAQKLRREFFFPAKILKRIFSPTLLHVLLRKRKL